MVNVDLHDGGGWNVAGSAIVVLFGVAVAFAKPRSRAQQWFVAFAITWGISSGMSNFNWEPEWAHKLWWAVMASFGIVFPVALVGLIRAYVGRPERMASWLIALVPAVILLAITFGVPLATGLAATFESLTPLFGIEITGWLVMSWVALLVYCVVSWAGAGVFAFWAAQGDAQQARQAALLSSAIVIFPAAFAGVVAPAVPTISSMGGFLAASLLGAIWSGALWIRVAAKGIAPRQARNAALVPLLTGLIALVVGLGDAPWFGGAARVLMAVMLGYAVLRHQAFGIDAKLRFGISKSALAGIFVAVFFVVSEAAQTFFGQETGNEYYGIAAAGLLLFGIAPLQRFADRFAEKAVPAVPIQAASDAEGEYRELASMAWCDGSISGRERKRLRDARIRLGLDADTAELIETDVAVNSG